jgi:carbon starvation protein
VASAVIVAGWGWFLIQGVTDPMGGINALWPLFGISNQLLAAVALSVGTTLIIKRGVRRYAWVTVLPLTWLLVITTTASWQKLFHLDPRIGFLGRARQLAVDLSVGVGDPELTERLIRNSHINAGLTAVFLVVTWLVVASSVRVWLDREQRTENRVPIDERRKTKDERRKTGRLER